MNSAAYIILIKDCSLYKENVTLKAMSSNLIKY